jgi:hypothetical protein
VAPLTDVPVEVRTEDEEPDILVWESATLRTVPADVPSSVFDPDVTDGSLAALSAPDTVAISSDAASLIGLGTGDSLAVRYDGAEHALEVVAVYERGLGVGGYLIAPDTATSLGSDATPSTLLVTTTDGATTAQTADRIRDLGYTVQSPGSTPPARPAPTPPCSACPRCCCSCSWSSSSSGPPTPWCSRQRAGTPSWSCCTGPARRAGSCAGCCSSSRCSPGCSRG